jgi:hypothetical protein
VKLSHTEGGAKTEGVWEQSAEENTLDLRGRKWRDRGEIHNLQASANIRVIISRRRIWTEYVARMGDEMHKILWLENLKKRDLSEDVGR